MKIGHVQGTPSHETVRDVVVLALGSGLDGHIVFFKGCTKWTPGKRVLMATLASARATQSRHRGHGGGPNQEEYVGSK